MLYVKYDREAEMAIVREEEREENRLFFLALLDQDLTIQEIKQRLTQPAGEYIVR
jgi:hypothetical protein